MTKRKSRMPQNRQSHPKLKKHPGNPHPKPPPVEHQFKKGQSGNPGGRPKLLGESYRAMLARVEEGQEQSNAERIAVALKDEAVKGNVQAAREVRAATEGEKLRDYVDDIADVVREGKATLDDVRAEFGADIAARAAARLGLLPSQGGAVQEPRATER